MRVNSTKKDENLVKIKDATSSQKDGKFILYIEFQSSHDADMPQQMMAYYARIVDKYQLPVYPVVLYLNRGNSNKKLNIPNEYVNSILEGCAAQPGGLNRN